MTNEARLPLGVAHFSAIDVPPVAFARLAAKSGFSSIGLRLHPAFAGAPFYQLPVGSAVSRDLVSILAGEGIQVYDIEFVVIDPGFIVGNLEPVLASAAALGAKRLSVCGDDPDRSRLVANFGALCDLAAGFGMAVDIENMGWRVISSFADSVEVATVSGRANAGVLVDALHFYRNGGTATQLLAAPAELIRSIQLCDAGANPPLTAEGMVLEARSQRLAPGEGSLPLSGLVACTPSGAVFSVEVPLTHGTAVDEHLEALFSTAQAMLRAGPGSHPDLGAEPRA